MTEEDREQMRQLLREDREEISKDFSARLNHAVESVTKDFATRLDAAIVSVGADFSELREEMNRRFDKVDQRFGTVERGIERMETRLTAIDLQIAGINRNLDQSERSVLHLIATQTAQQKFMDDLALRVKRIERELHLEDR